MPYSRLKKKVAKERLANIIKVNVGTHIRNDNKDRKNNAINGFINRKSIPHRSPIFIFEFKESLELLPDAEFFKLLSLVMDIKSKR